MEYRTVHIPGNLNTKSLSCPGAHSAARRRRLRNVGLPSAQGTASEHPENPTRLGHAMSRPGRGRATKGSLNILRCTMGSANAAGACTMRSDSDTGPAPAGACAGGPSPYACACAARLSICRQAGAACAAPRTHSQRPSTLAQPYPNLYKRSFPLRLRLHCQASRPLEARAMAAHGRARTFRAPARSQSLRQEVLAHTRAPALPSCSRATTWTLHACVLMPKNGQCETRLAPYGWQCATQGDGLFRID